MSDNLMIFEKKNQAVVSSRVIAERHTIDEEMAHGTYYKEIYKKCKANGHQIMRFAYLPARAA